MNYPPEALQAMRAILHPQLGRDALLPLHDNQYNLNTNVPQLHNRELAQAVARAMLNAEYLNLPLEEYGHARLELDNENQPSQLILVLVDIFGSGQLYEEVFNFPQDTVRARWKEVEDRD